MKIIIILVIVVILFIKFNEPIFDMIMYVTEFFEGIGDFFSKVKGNVEDQIEDRKAKELAKEKAQLESDQYHKFQHFEKVEELPDDIESLGGLCKNFRNRGDDQRAFLCLKKAVDLDKGSFEDKQQLKKKLADYYYKGIGTELNLELGRKYQAECIVNEIRAVIKEDAKVVNVIKGYWMGYDLIDPQCLYLVAQELCNLPNPVGVFLLEDVMLAMDNGITRTTDKDQRREIYKKLTGNAYALYHLWCLNNQEKAFLERSAELGCYYAAVTLKKTELVDKLKLTVNHCLERGAASALEYAGMQSEGARQSLALFEQGKLAHAANPTDGNAIRQIEEAAGLGNEQARIWLIRYRAEQGRKEAEYEYASMQEQGTYWVEQSKEQAAMLYMRSAIQGYAKAQYRYGQMLEHGELGMPKNKEQAFGQYIKAAEQGYLPACIKVGKDYSRGSAEQKALAEKYLKRVVALDHSVKGHAKYLQEAWYTLMQMYRGYQFHAEPYPELGKAFVCAVEYLRLAEPNNKKKMDAIPQALEGNPASIGTLASEYFVDIQHSKISEEGAAIVIPVHETFLLQQASIYEALAEQGDVRAMCNLFFLYDEVGSYSLYQSVGIPIKTLRFSGNKARGNYWLDMAIAKGDVKAMRYKGEYYYMCGITREEGEEYLEMAARRGDSLAADTLEVRQLEIETKARYAAEAKRLMESLSSTSSDSVSTAEKESGPIPIEWIPDVITGPYGHQYRMVMRGAYSAVYENVDSGVQVTIKESQIGMSGSSATTAEGYFHW